MAKKNHTVEQIIGKLREAEVRLSQGETVGQVSRSLSITEQTYYRWRKEYGGLNRYFPDSIRIVANRRRTRPPMEGILLCGHSAAPI